MPAVAKENDGLLQEKPRDHERQIRMATRRLIEAKERKQEARGHQILEPREAEPTIFRAPLQRLPFERVNKTENKKNTEAVKRAPTKRKKEKTSHRALPLQYLLLKIFQKQAD
ncbi:hypothetical protein OSTOST_02894, partial [Ostertagia ostertagi]